MDYVLVTYMVSASSALSYAVGEWARVWLLQSLIRAMGGYFVRRDRANPLYRKVLARYVHMAVTSAVAQAVFPRAGSRATARCGRPNSGCSATWCRASIPMARATSCSCRSASTTTACSRTACTARLRTPGGDAARLQSAGADGACSAIWLAAAGAPGIASAMPASASARRCRCRPTIAARHRLPRAAEAHAFADQQARALRLMQIVGALPIR